MKRENNAIRRAPPPLHDPLRYQEPGIELNHTPTDDETAEVLRRGVKRRRESVEAFEKAGRTELADREKAEIKALEEFLPAAVAPRRFAPWCVRRSRVGRQTWAK